MSGIDLPNEVQGLVPSTEWKREKMHEKWYAGETISVGIGQGAVSVTPVSMAVYMATLANGGTRVTPHLLKAVDDGTGWKPVPAPPPQSKIDDRSREAAGDPRRPVDGRQRAAARAARARIAGHDVSGKTGTAQVISNAGRQAAARRQGPARQRLVRVLRAAGQPEDRRRRVPRARHPRRATPRASRTTSSTRSSRSRTAGRCRRRRRTSRSRLDYKRTVRPGCDIRAAVRRFRSDVRTTTLLPHRLGAARRHPRAVRDRRRDDLQHDRGSARAASSHL